jgi:lipid-binding SYLF domain-containing protein
MQTALSASGTLRRAKTKRLLGIAAITLLAIAPCWAEPGAAGAASAQELDRDASTALAKLYKDNDAAHLLGQQAKGVLVFPNIVKAGFLFGGQIGEGVLRRGGTTAGYYNSVAASYGLQAGIQSFGYAMFFMDDASLAAFEKSAGFEVGVGPTIVVVDKGAAKSLTTETVKKGIYAFIFDQSGLMAGVGLQGSKISRVSK